MKSWVLAAVAAIGLGGAAEAAVVFEFERVSDKEARISANGSFDAMTGRVLIAPGVLSGGGWGNDLVSGDFKVGDSGFYAVYGRAGTSDLVLHFNAPSLGPWSTINGSSVITVNDEIWAAIGTTGSVIEAVNGRSVGSFSVVGRSIEDTPPAVPLPAGLPLLAAGMGLLGWAARRRS